MADSETPRVCQPNSTAGRFFVLGRSFARQAFHYYKARKDESDRSLIELAYDAGAKGLGYYRIGLQLASSCECTEKRRMEMERLAAQAVVWRGILDGEALIENVLQRPDDESRGFSNSPAEGKADEANAILAPSVLPSQDYGRIHDTTQSLVSARLVEDDARAKKSPEGFEKALQEYETTILNAEEALSQPVHESVRQNLIDKSNFARRRKHVLGAWMSTHMGSGSSSEGRKDSICLENIALPAAPSPELDKDDPSAFFFDEAQETALYFHQQAETLIGEGYVLLQDTEQAPPEEAALRRRKAKEKFARAILYFRESIRLEPDATKRLNLEGSLREATELYGGV